MSNFRLAKGEYTLTSYGLITVNKLPTSQPWLINRVTPNINTLSLGTYVTYDGHS